MFDRVKWHEEELAKNNRALQLYEQDMERHPELDGDPRFMAQVIRIKKYILYHMQVLERYKLAKKDGQL